MAKQTTTPRGTKSPAQRAQEALDTATRVVTRAEKRLADARAAVTPLETELQAAKKRRDYLAQNPDLPAQPGDTQAAHAADGDTPDA